MARVGRIQKRVAVTWQEALEDYLRFKQAEGLREDTLQHHRETISLLFTRYPEAWRGDLKRSAYKFLGESVKPATYNYRLSYLKSFFNWGIEEGIFTENPVSCFKKRKAEGRIVELDLSLLQRLLSLPDQETFAGLRDYTLMLLTLDTGIRPKEAFSLMLDDINLKTCEVYIRAEEAKTKVSRVLPISHETVRSIQRLISARHPSWGEEVPVFCSCEGNRMTRNTWECRMKIYSRKLGTKVRPYDLRHNFATGFLRNGGNVITLQRIMGHSDISMTQRYVHLVQTDIREQHNRGTPLNVLMPKKSVRLRKI